MAILSFIGVSPDSKQLCMSVFWGITRLKTVVYVCFFGVSPD